MVGQMLSMFALIFQLTASGGTFPTELTQGGLFLTLHPFVPFTYSINALREAISGVPANSGVVLSSLCIQFFVVIAAVALSVVIEVLRSKKKVRKILVAGK